MVFVLTVLGAIALFSALRARGQHATGPGHRAGAAGAGVGRGGGAATRARRGRRAARPARGGRGASLTIRCWSRNAAPASRTLAAARAPREYRSSDTGTYRPVSGETETFRAITESDVFRPVSDSGGYRAVSDSGGYRAVSDSGGYRAASDSGTHRANGRPKARHSTRR